MTTKRHTYRWLSIITAVLVVQLMELLLLEKKYNLFTSGFLQPYSYKSWEDKLLFIGLGLWFDIILFGALGLLWFYIAGRRGTHPLLSAYNYLFLVISSMGMWLALKFKVLTYFNDTLNFLIIRNLGGGSLTQAFRFVAAESVIFSISLAILIAAYWAGRRVIKHHINGWQDAPSPPVNNRLIWALFLILTVGLVFWISTEPQLRYGLGKKTSYILISEALNTLSDVDRDGYGLFRFPKDNDNFDSTIHPGALDIPNNGIDEDSYGGDFKWNGKETPDTLTSLEPQPGKHILLIVLESARGDLIGKRLNGQLVAPFMTAMATNGTSIPNAYSHTGYTVTSLKAIFNRTLLSKDDRILLADYLDQSGYALSFISGQAENFGDVATDTRMNAPGHYFFDASSALDDRVYPSTDLGSLRLSEKRVFQQFQFRADEVDWDQPNFFYINLQAAHFPYSYPGIPAIINDHPIARKDISQENREALQATYWNAIAVADRTVRSMIDVLKKKGVYEKTLVVILGDHGESLFDDNFLGHGHALDEAQTRIPLIINQKNIEIMQAVGQIDIAELVVTIATGRFDPGRWANSSHPQFQFVGSINNPQLIGIVSAGEIRTLLDLRTRKVFFSDKKLWKPFDEAINDQDLGNRVRQLIDIWEHLRWKSHLVRNTKQ